MMAWLAAIQECVKQELARRGHSPEALAREIRTEGRRISAATVRAVLDAEPGTRANSIEAVVEALGLEIIATCVPAGTADVAEAYRAAIVELERDERTKGQGDMVNMNAARELLGMCQHLATIGLAAEAVRVLYRWRGSVDSDGGKVVGRPLV